MLAFLYSLAGSTLCLFAMLPLHKILPRNCIWLCSMAGAVFHNIGQFCVAFLIMGSAILAYLPFLIVSGFITGLFTGLCSQILVQKLEKFNLKRRYKK